MGSRAIATFVASISLYGCTLISLDDLRSGTGGGHAATSSDATSSSATSGSTGSGGSQPGCDPMPTTGSGCSLGSAEHCSRCDQDCMGGACSCAGGACPGVAFACGPGAVGNDIGFGLKADASDVFVVNVRYLKREAKTDLATSSTTVLTQAMTSIGAFVLDGPDVYYGADDGGIFRIAKMGGIPQIIGAVSTGAYHAMIRIDDELVIGTGSTDSLRRIKLPCSNVSTGCTPEIVAHTSNTSAIQTDATAYYFTALGANGQEIDRIARDGSMVDPILMDDQPEIGGPLLLVGDDLYYAVGRTIYRMGKTDAKGSANPPKQLIDLSSSLTGTIYALAYDDCAHLYVAATSSLTSSGRIVRFGLDGSGPVDVVANNDTQSDGGLAIDALGVYFAGEAGIFRVVR